MIKYRTFFSKHEGTPEQLKVAYQTWKSGAIAVPADEKVEYYYKTFVLDGITFEDFQNLVKEEA